MQMRIVPPLVLSLCRRANGVHFFPGVNVQHPFELCSEVIQLYVQRPCGSLFHIHDWCVRQVSVYQHITSPLLPPACRFIPMFPVHESAPICRLDHYEYMDRLDQHNMIASDVV